MFRTAILPARRTKITFPHQLHSTRVIGTHSQANTKYATIITKLRAATIDTNSNVPAD